MQTRKMVQSVERSETSQMGGICFANLILPTIRSLGLPYLAYPILQGPFHAMSCWQQCNIPASALAYLSPCIKARQHTQLSPIRRSYIVASKVVSWGHNISTLPTSTVIDSRVSFDHVAAHHLGCSCVEEEEKPIFI